MNWAITILESRIRQFYGTSTAAKKDPASNFDIKQGDNRILNSPLPESDIFDKCYRLSPFLMRRAKIDFHPYDRIRNGQPDSVAGILIIKSLRMIF